MYAILQLLAILVLGFLSAHFIFGRLQHHLYFITGVEYIILGILCGPRVTDIMTDEVIYQLGPVVSLAIGALGVLYGLQLRGRRWVGVAVEYYRISFVEVFFTLLLVGGTFGAIFWFGLGGEGEVLPVFAAAAALAAAASVSAPTAIDAMTRRYSAKGRLTELLRFLVSLNQIIGIAMFGLIFCLYRVGTTHGINITQTEWVAISLGFGLALGLLFYLFLGGVQSEQRLLLALMGIVVFSSGVAYYLNLSPLAMNLFLGLVLGITSGTREKLLKILLSFQRPLYVLILIFAGASWRFTLLDPLYMGIGLIALYALVRTAAKYSGGWIAQRTSDDRDKLPPQLGLGLLSQGAVAVAMAVNYQQVYNNRFTGVVVSCILGSVIISEFFGQRTTRNILVDAAEIAIDKPSGGSLKASDPESV